jgi:hypothetical protein
MNEYRKIRRATAAAIARHPVVWHVTMIGGFSVVLLAALPAWTIYAFVLAAKL